jgi:ferredoxin/flavodoxin
MMNIKLFYFSGTGNSLIVAKDIAKKVKADLVSIPKIINTDKIHIDAESIGIIFPSYMAPLSGQPLIIERFIRKIANIESLHIFSVCTCGGYECVNALPSLKKLKKIIRSCGGKLSDEYSTRLPMNNLEYDHIPIPIIRDHEIIINRSKTKIDDICYRIINKRGTKCKIAKILFNLLMEPVYEMIRQSVIDSLKEKAQEPIDTKLKYFELMPLTDKSIAVDKKCTGCGICAKVCPVNNITIVEKRPEFQHKCEMCFACDEWCPSNAIHHWSRSIGVKYHHPEVKLTDML